MTSDHPSPRHATHHVIRATDYVTQWDRMGKIGLLETVFGRLQSWPSADYRDSLLRVTPSHHSSRQSSRATRHLTAQFPRRAFFLTGIQVERVRQDGGEPEIDESHAIAGGPLFLSRSTLHRKTFGQIHLRIIDIDDDGIEYDIENDIK